METVHIAECCADLLGLRPAGGIPAYVSEAHAHLGRLIGSAEGHVVLALRTAAPDDPLKGFRPIHSFTIGRRGTSALSMTPEAMRDDELLLNDPGIRRVIEGAGHHRAFHDPDPRTVPEMRGSIEERFWRDRGICDRLRIVHALDEGCELHLGFDRFVGEPPFTDGEEEALARVNVALGPWARRVAFLHGYGDGLTPLSARERDTLCFLLSDAPQKLLPAHLKLSEARSRELVRSLYAKFGITRRIELIWRWVVQRPPSPPTEHVVATRRSARRRSGAAKSSGQ